MRQNFPGIFSREPLIKTGRIELRRQMIKIKAGNAVNSRAIRKFSNTDIDFLTLKSIVHVLIRGSLINLLVSYIKKGIGQGDGIHIFG